MKEILFTEISIIWLFTAFMWGMIFRPYIYSFFHTLPHKFKHLHQDTPKKFRAWRICRGNHNFNELSKVFTVSHVTCFKCDVEYILAPINKTILYNHCTARNYEQLKSMGAIHDKAEQTYKKFFNPEGGSIDGYPEN